MGLQWYTHFSTQICIGQVWQPLAKFLGEMWLVMIVPAARILRSFFQQVKESDRIVKPNHEQDVVLIGEMGVHRKMWTTARCGQPCFGIEGPVAILYPVGVDFSIEDEA